MRKYKVAIAGATGAVGREMMKVLEEREFPVGEYKWITVVSPEGPADVELSLEPNANPAAKTFQRAMFDQGIPLAAFEVGDIAAEFARLKAAAKRGDGWGEGGRSS